MNSKKYFAKKELLRLFLAYFEGYDSNVTTITHGGITKTLTRSKLKKVLDINSFDNHYSLFKPENKLGHKERVLIVYNTLFNRRKYKTIYILLKILRFFYTILIVFLLLVTFIIDLPAYGLVKLFPKLKILCWPWDKLNSINEDINYWFINVIIKYRL